MFVLGTAVATLKTFERCYIGNFQIVFGSLDSMFFSRSLDNQIQEYTVQGLAANTRGFCRDQHSVLALRIEAGTSFPRETTDMEGHSSTGRWRGIDVI